MKMSELLPLNFYTLILSLLKTHTLAILLGSEKHQNGTVEFANSVDPDEVAHHEPPHQDLYCFPSSI